MRYLLFTLGTASHAKNTACSQNERGKNILEYGQGGKHNELLNSYILFIGQVNQIFHFSNLDRDLRELGDKTD
jgi:hypothetical protein